MNIPEYKVITNGDGEKEYVLCEPIYYYSKRYKKNLTVPEGYHSDGASGALDIHSAGWWVHDKICDNPMWDDCVKITAYQAAQVLSDILFSEGRYFRSLYWKWSTLFFGCFNARKNGWFKKK